MAFCFDSSPCATLSSRSCSTHLVILFSNSAFPPELYSILIISPLSCPRVCCLLSVRKHLFCSSDYLSAVVLADFVLLLFSSPVGLVLLFLHPFFLILSPASIGLWSALCPGFSLFVCSSLHGIPPAHLCSHPALLLDLSGGCLLPSRCLSAPPARLKPVSVRWMPAGWFLGLSFCFRCINTFLFCHLLLDSGLVPDSTDWPLWIQRVRSLCDQPLLIKELFSAIKPASSRPQVRRFRLSQPRWRN